MKKLHISALAVILASAWWLPVLASTASVDDIVKQLQAKVADIQDMRGKFSQTSHLKDLERIETYEGEFFIKKPSSMRWRYSEPRDEEVVIRNAETWIYKKSEKQVVKTALSEGSYGQIPLALLNSLGDLEADFDITLFQDGILELKPKRSMGYIKGALLEVTRSDFPISKFSILDTHGNQVIIKIEKVKINSGLEDAFFMFKAPPGVEVFDLSR
jgi:outer membrane lipoprotein carrier protein